MRKITTLAAATAIASITALPAQAAVTFDPATGAGFVGKGDVQLAFGWNNTQLQNRAASVSFSSSQPAAQTSTQDLTQAGSQTSTQQLTREVSCIIEGKRQTHVGEGYRLGEREGERIGDREGTRSGTLAGVLSSALDGDPRQTKGQKQFTGFILKGYVAPGLVFTPGGDFTWGEAEFGDYEFSAWSYDEIEWSGWQSEPGENPADCLGGNPGVTDLSDVTTEGAIIEGDIVDGVITEGATQTGAVTATGAAVISATYNSTTVALP